MSPAEITGRVLDRADLEEGEYVTSEELQDILVEIYGELHEIKLNALGEEAPFTRTVFTVEAEADTLDISADDGVYRILRIELQSTDGLWLPILRGNIGAGQYDGTMREWRDGPDVQYIATRLERTFPGHDYAWRIHFDPPTRSEKDIRIWHHDPPAITFDEDGLVTSYPDSSPEYVINAAAAVLARKQEIDPKEFDDERERQRTRLERYSRPLQTTQPKKINDGRAVQRRYNTNTFMNRRP